MDRFLVRRTKPASEGVGAGINGTAVVAEGSPSKKLRTECGDAPGGALPELSCGGGCEPAAGDPETIISWNVNGLAVQLRDNWSLIKAFLEHEQADVICLQEVRLPAAGPKGCKRGDGKKRRRGEAKCETAQDKADWQLVQRTLLAAFSGTYCFYWALADWKYSGTLMMVRRTLRPSRVLFTMPLLSAAGGHASHRDPADPLWHPEGRVIVASFATFDLLATYSPNNGNDEPSFARRAAWDSAMKQDVTQRTRPLVWIGDLNCAAEPVDVTHPDWFLQQAYQGELEDMRGQPGFTEGERKRFRELLEAGRLVDSFRRLHPAESPPPASGPHFTWRGHPPVHQAMAKYHGKGMRIDYALIDQDLLPRLVASDILGQGADRHGYMGSDHSPIRLRLQPAASGAGVAEAKAVPAPASECVLVPDE